MQSSKQWSLRYGRALIDHGVDGLREGQQSYLHGRSVLPYLSESARASAPAAAFGAIVALLPFWLAERPEWRKRAMLCSVAGTAMGFLAAFSWKTRHLAASMGRSAVKQIGYVRDEHWLESHPIDYA